MKEVLVAAIGIAAMIAQPLATFSIGVETGGPQLRTLVTRPGLNFRYFLATFVITPALAIAVGLANLLPASLWAGLALMSIAPPAPPATRKLKKIGNFDVGLAWQAEAFLISVVTVPFTVVLVSAMLGRELNLTWAPVLVRGLLFFAAPMTLGLLVRRYASTAADALAKPVAAAAGAALLVLVALVAIVAVPVVAHFGIRPIAVVTLFVAGAIAVAHLVGGPGRDTRVTLAAMLATRFPVPAIVLAQANGAVKAVLPVVLVYFVAGALLVPLYDRFFAFGIHGSSDRLYT